MNAERQMRYQRNRDFAIDKAGTRLTLAHRLARENGWGGGYCLWVIDEYKFSRPNWAPATAAAIVPLFGIAWNPLDLAGPEFLLVFGLTFLMALVASLFVRNAARAADDGLAGNDLDPFEVAVLSDGEGLAAKAAIMSLLQQGALHLEFDQLRTGGAVPEGATPLERAAFQSVASKQPIAPRDVIPDCAQTAAEIRARLENRGLLETTKSFAFVRTFVILLMSGVLALGVAKIWVGIEREKPVLFLLAACLATLFVFMALLRRPHRTPTGSRVLTSLGAKREDLRDCNRADMLTGPDLALAIGLFGVGTLINTPYATMELLTAEPTEKPSGWFSSGSDGGGCGGGGGGGGGCGG